MKNKHNDRFLGEMPKWLEAIAGVYKLTHLTTGKFYIGSTGNFYRRRKNHIVDLRRREHPVKELQDLYDKDPELKFEFFLTGFPRTDNKARELAYIHEQQMLDDNKNNPLLLNTSLSATSIVLRPELEEKRLRNTRLALQSKEVKDKLGLKSKAYRSTKEAKEKHSRIALDQWSNPEIRAKHLSTRRRPENIAKSIQRNIDLGFSKKVMVAGKIYNSVSEASRDLKITRLQIRRRIAHKKLFKDYKYLD